MLEHVHAVRYVTPLREGGSLPGIVEADDEGTYVLKFRGAGQGLKVLVAEVIVGEIGRAIGLRVPDLRAVTLDARIARYEADQEVQDLLTASVGLNLGVDFLPGSFTADGGQDSVARRVHSQHRPHVEQPEPVGMARADLGDRPWGSSVLPSLLAHPRTRPGPLRRPAVRRRQARPARCRG